MNLSFRLQTFGELDININIPHNNIQINKPHSSPIQPNNQQEPQGQHPRTQSNAGIRKFSYLTSLNLRGCEVVRLYDLDTYYRAPPIFSCFCVLSFGWEIS
ncbi:hypothetical protein OCU04_006425 [Sclerotinia nivalis]|uniref:Uncharacterized protein n=1 Tax=Sclerotinia nivalis TaxID=352851 RepID=A0A9X0AN85_9HELO|nr:hypothetical protein OCU04_006425 [Sclerotinia nivalis]